MRRFPYMTFLLSLVIALFAVVSSVQAQDAPTNLPDGFRLIGNYQLKSKVKVEKGISVPVVISPLRYRVYSDGIEVRVYCGRIAEESYTNYEIYRSDGIGVTKSSGGIEVVAGVQAICKKGEMIRQLSVTRSSLTMVKMPPRSNRVIVTRAVSISQESSAPSADKK